MELSTEMMLPIPAAKVPKSKPWSEKAEILLVQLVVASHRLLFGDIKSCGVQRVSQRRRKTWDDIARSISLQDTNARTVEQCRKKFQNLKAKTMAKGTQLRHKPTGGGSAPELSIPERLLLDHLDGRSVLHGIYGATYSDAPATCSGAMPVIDATQIEEIPHATFSQPIASCADQQAITTIPVLPDSQVHEEKVQKKIKKGNQSDANDTIDVLTRKNLSLDCMRLKKECDKLEKEKEMFQAKKDNLIIKKDILTLQKQYLQNKLLTDFPSGDSFLDSMNVKLFES